MNKTNSLSVIVPVLNEENNIRKAIRNMLKSFSDLNIDWELILINDGSSDGTDKVIDELSQSSPQIKILHHKSPMGVGFSVREGMQVATKDAVVYYPGDDEADPTEIFKYLPLLEHVDMVVPFLVNKEIRSKSRRFLSDLFLLIINFSFGTSFNYTQGTVILKKRIFDVVNQKSNGFFFQTECLVKASKAGFTFAEVPYRGRGKLKSHSKATSLKSLVAVSLGYLRLLYEVYLK